MTADRIVRSRRINAWWEPTYAPQLFNALSEGDWTLRDNAADRRLFTPDNFSNQVAAREKKRKFKKTRFTSCDFSGSFRENAIGAVFDECHFENCDFGTSTWEKVKFRKCNFERCSFSQSTWINAEFRECFWSEIGISGNETVFEEVFISNPSKFISAAFTNTDPDVVSERGINKKFQLLKLEQTKATVARSIFNCHKSTGDDASFYAAFSTYMSQYTIYRICEAKWQLRQEKFSNKPGWLVRYVDRKFEYLLNRFFGIVTAWGSSSFRPLVFLAATFLTFIGAYRIIGISNWRDAVSTSFDVTSIAGFTRSITSQSSDTVYVVACANLVISILFYSAFFSVAISKISRTR